MAEKKLDPIYTTTPPVRLSYPSVFTPRAVEAGQDPKYSVVIMLSKSDPAHVECMKKLKADAEKMLFAKWPRNADGTLHPQCPRIPIVGHDKSPIKDADTASDQQGVPLREKNPEYAGHWVIRASTKSAPAVVGRDRQELLDKSKIYGGCFAKVNINPFTFVGAQNRGVTFGLNGVQFWADGDSFSSRPKADDMFAADDGSEDPSAYSADPFA